MDLNLDDIKKELKEYFANKTIIDEFEKRNGKIEQLKEQAIYSGSVITGMPKGTPKVQDQKAELVATYVDLQQKNYELEIEYAVGLLKLKNQNLIVHSTIMKLSSTSKAILLHLYVNNMTRSEVAAIMKKTDRYMSTLINYALEEYLSMRNRKE